MHWNLPDILADSDADAIKIGIYVIIGVIWLISAMVKKVVKGMSAARRPAPTVWTPPPTAPQVSSTVVSAVRVPWKPVAVPAPQAALPVAPLPNVKVVKKKQKRAKQESVAEPQRVALAAVAAEVAPAMAVSSGAAGPSAAAQMLRAQLQPGTLRREFLTMELLGKPLALREGPGSGGLG